MRREVSTAACRDEKIITGHSSSFIRKSIHEKEHAAHCMCGKPVWQLTLLLVLGKLRKEAKVADGAGDVNVASQRKRFPAIEGLRHCKRLVFRLDTHTHKI